jgi:ferritin-like metal-binding protein YciE
MTSPDRKIVEFLEDARDSERELTRVLESQIAAAPGGDYRRELQLHLRQSREHVHALRRRLDLMRRGSPLQRLIGGAINRWAGLVTLPLELFRVSGREPEKVLRSAQDACAAEAAGIATYTAIERLARRTGDEETAALARSIREHEQEMFERLQAHLRPLTDAMVAAQLDVDVRHCTVSDADRLSSVRPD